MNVDDGLRPDEIVELTELLPGLSNLDLKLIQVAAPEEFSIAENLILYSRMVGDVVCGQLVVIEVLEALCSYREDLDAQLQHHPDTPLRARLVERLDLIDEDYLRVTLHATPKWRRAPASEAWWWNRTPRRTDQRLNLEGRWNRESTIPEMYRAQYAEWRKRHGV